MSINYGCIKIYKLIQKLFKDNYDYEKMTKSYFDISSCGQECKELRDYDGDIEKDLLRTFPKVP